MQKSMVKEQVEIPLTGRKRQKWLTCSHIVCDDRDLQEVEAQLRVYQRTCVLLIVPIDQRLETDSDIGINDIAA